ncbi:TIGR03761 family integrating conjugative element protein [Halomonas sabkhae]|uniref:PFL_4669 family integrating conjugative element protein n=1 Tax=Halomonas sabkhae TaxID=626223 RepID=UPI0025B57712|nr:TIGR03761 family integrating conjugative element protein [Halomonas sabkhae]MDN3525347.1 TIGR03761 family integrating conjugative element protein [Halomonas sabkhae]
MAAQAQQQMGALRSKIRMTLHTYQATRLWHGRGVESGKPQIIGMRQMLAMIGKIQRDAAQDDPYADYWLIQIEDKLRENRQYLNNQLHLAEKRLARLPDQLTVEENLSQQPFTTPIYTGGQLGWLAIRQLIDYDRLIRQVVLAGHIAQMSRNAEYNILRGVHRKMHGLVDFPKRYPGYSGITRDDLAANNARARQAIEKRGELPDDVAQGKRRSKYAPPIRKTPPNSKATPAATRPDASSDETEAAPDTQVTGSANATSDTSTEDPLDQDLPYG